MSAPTPAPGDDRPREGYYPDPSIPGYVRYWNGTAWVPGTSRPAPRDGEPLTPPPGSRRDPAPVEETGPHFFDEDPQPAPSRSDEQYGTRPEPASAWGADRSHQVGFGGETDQRVSWGAPSPTDPRVPADIPSHPTGNPTHGDGTTDIPPTGDSGRAGGSGAVREDGTMTFRSLPRRTGQQEGSAGARQGGTGASGTSASGMDGASAGARGDEAAGAAGGAFGAGGGPGSAGDTGGAAGGQGGFGSGSGAAADGSNGPGFGAGKAAAARAAAAKAQTGAQPQGGPQPGPQSGPQAQSGPQGGRASLPAQSGPQARSGLQAHPLPPQSPGTPQVPHQSAAAQSPAQLPAQSPAPQPTPMTTGPGGGQSSWAQQVHRLAGADDEQPVVPWKPPVEDPFQAVVRRQAEARPAGMGKRLVARLVDSLVLGAVVAVAAVPLGTKAVDHIVDKIDAAKLSGRTETVWLLDGTTSVYLGVVLAVLLVFGVLYEALPTARWGRTLGKKLCGLEVRDIEGHEPPSFGAALRRWLVYSVPGLLGIGVLGVVWCLFDRPWHQCWHDKAAHTFVAG